MTKLHTDVPGGIIPLRGLQYEASEVSCCWQSRIWSTCVSVGIGCLAC